MLFQLGVGEHPGVLFTPGGGTFHLPATGACSTLPAQGMWGEGEAKVLSEHLVAEAGLARHAVSGAFLSLFAQGGHTPISD